MSKPYYLPHEEGQQEAGWYYRDADGSDQGPYDTEQEAQKASDEDEPA